DEAGDGTMSTVTVSTTGSARNDHVDAGAAYMTVEGLKKAFGRVQAVDNVSFDVRRGEFLTLLGPSGCGKSTTLRLIAGLERPDEGEISIEDRLITSARRGVFTA